MKALMDLRKVLCKELEAEARKGELSAGSLETVHKLTDTIKNIDKIHMLEADGGTSEFGGTYDRGSYAPYSRNSYGNSYGDDGYAGAYNRMGGGYSRAEGGDMIRERIEDMMKHGDMSASERGILQRAMQIMNDR